jgi:hypothetical protein
VAKAGVATAGMAMEVAMAGARVEVVTEGEMAWAATAV